ncbi:peptidase C14, caspase catalytic subunit p20 [Aquicoccus sp. SCR17]|nr:peptidase C14, caspase catalytic subunit p20 [Carideicomes alvinocaridis]
MPLLRLLLIVVAALWLVPAAAQQRVALVIGNSDYKTVGALENPFNDASDISIALEGLGFDVLLGTDLGHDEMLEATDRFGAMAAESDVALVYYAGHGFQVDGTNYLVPVDAAIARAEDVPDQTLPMQMILNAMAKAPGLKLVFLDACRDNPFGAALEEGDMGEGLARVGTEKDFLFAYSTQPDNVAYDGTGRNSFFTEAVLNHIYTPGQDIAQMLINVRRDVIASTGGRQVPWDNSSLTQQFRFDTSPPTASEETLLWQVAAKARDPQLMELYMDRYPQGDHLGDVVAFLETEPDTLTRNLGQMAEDGAEADRLWRLARRTRMRPLLEFYLEEYPQGEHAGQARRLLETIPRPEDAAPGAVCERLATHPRDATAVNGGVSFDWLQRNALAAIQACSAAVTQSPELPHYMALLARATAASGDLERAVQLYKRASDRGDLRAMVSLAQLYEAGNGVPQEPQTAMTLYERAAEGGSHDAQINLAVALFQGAGVAQDTDRAISLLRQAADSGSAKATYNLGVLAQDGAIDTPAAALDYFERAAAEGESPAFRAAAILLDEGRGVSRDPGRAANMLLRGAAEDRGEILQMLSESADQWSRETLREVQSRLKTAGFYTKAVDGVPGPNFTAALEKWRNGGFDADVLVN